MSTNVQFKNPFQKAKLYRYPYGDVLQGFGENPALYKQHTSLGIQGHNGVDLYQPYGTHLLAVCDGTIAEINENPQGYGQHIRMISQWVGGECYEITYGHLSKIKSYLKPGDKVFAGEYLGDCGNSGFVVSAGVPYWGGSNPDKGGTHLHFGIREFSLSDTGWMTTYSTGNYYVKNYDNGFRGAIDPMPFFKDEIEKQAQSVIELAKKIINQVKQYLKIYV